MSWHTATKDSWTLPQYLLLSQERKVKHRPRYRHNICNLNQNHNNIDNTCELKFIQGRVELFS